MAAKLRAEIKQAKPFATLEQEVLLNVVRTADFLLQAFEQMLRPSGLSHTQYNVLRILRGAGKRGLGCREIGERMLTHDPDITRLLDRLERRDLAVRERDREDRRVVTTRITPEGLRLLEELDQPLLDFHRRQLAHLGPERLQTLLRLMEEVRGTSG